MLGMTRGYLWIELCASARSASGEGTSIIPKRVLFGAALPSGKLLAAVNRNESSRVKSKQGEAK